MLYPITEIFHSIQGEGLNAGKSAVFLRLAGCNFNCRQIINEKIYTCDEPLHEDFSKIQQFTAKEIVDQFENSNFDIIVITGGEPTLFDLTELTTEIRDRFKGRISTPHPLDTTCHLASPMICIETNGTKPIRGRIPFVSVAPKPLKFAKVNTTQYCIETIHSADEIKLVVGWFKDNIEEQIEYFKTLKQPRAVIMLSPLTTFPEGNLVPEATELAVKLVKADPELRLSPQWHKWVNIR